jgi:hypothetical protein
VSDFAPAFAPLRLEGATGLRLRDADPDELKRALAAHAAAGKGDDWCELKADRRARITAGASAFGPLVVKEYHPRAVSHRLADCVRGSPARRAWRGGHGLAALGIEAATPIAFLERRRFGLPLSSTAVLRDLRPAVPADACPPELASAEEILAALLDLVLGLHRRGVIHGDLKASHVYLHREDDRLVTRLIDLEGVRVPRRLTDAHRIQALAELNASLGAAIPDALRGKAFERYAAALPFDRGPDAALCAVVEASLRRRHRWSGSDCSAA